MKKIFISLAIACAALTGNAQTLSISTYSGTDMTPYSGQVLDVNVSRYIVNGWNTLSLPFAMTEDEINNSFGNDCRLEKLSGTRQEGNTVYLYFDNVKSQGIQPNTPYILYYTGQNGNVIINKEAQLDNAPSQISFTPSTGVTISMNGASTAKSSTGLYGILAADNKEAKFVNTTFLNSYFFATHCYITVAGADNADLVTIHNASDATGINTAHVTEQTDDNVYNISGCRVSKSAKGIKIINGKKQF